MAASKNLLDKDAKVIVKVGTNEKGKDLYKSINLKNIRVDAKDEDIYATAKFISSISAFSVAKIIEVDSSVIQG